MSSKRISNNRATRRNMSTDKFPSRKGLLKINELSTVATDGPNSYTPTLSDATNTANNSAVWWRMGRFMLIIGNVSWTGNGAGGTFTVSLPSGYSYDTSVLPGHANLDLFGYANWFELGVERHNCTMHRHSSGGFQFIPDDSTTAVSGIAFSNSDYIHYQIMVPIQGWTSQETQTIEEIIESSFFDLNVPLAANGQKGLLEYYNEATINLSGSGDFTGGTAKIVRINDTVSLEMTSANWTNSSSSQPRTASGLLPDWARPVNNDITKISGYSSSAILALFVGTDGTVGYDARNYSGTLVTNSSMSVARGITWVIDD